MQSSKTKCILQNLIDSESEDDEVSSLLVIMNNRKRKHRFWINSYILSRETKGEFYTLIPNR